MIAKKGFSIRFLGASQHIRITRAKAVTDIVWNKVEEMRPDGRVVKSVYGFPSIKNITHSPITSITDDLKTEFKGEGVDIGIPLASRLNGVPAVLTITVFVFSTGGVFTWGGRSVSVSPNTLKFNVKIDGWSYSDPRNHLAFGAKINSKMVKTDPNEAASSIDIDGMEMYSAMPVKASSGDNNDVKVVLEGSSVSWHFVGSAGASSLEYDPLITVSGTGTSSGSTPPPPSKSSGPNWLLIFSIIILVLAILAALWTYLSKPRRK